MRVPENFHLDIMPYAFVPRPPLPASARQTPPRILRMSEPPSPKPYTTSRRRLLSSALSLSAIAVLPTMSRASAVATNTVFMDISVAGNPAGRVVIALYAQEAPVSVDTFVKLINGTLRNRGGKTAGFKYSQAAKVVPDKRVELGRVKQIDALNQQPGLPQRQTVGVDVPENRDANQLHHDMSGLVSVRRGGSFEFSLMLAPDQAMDEQNLVIGRVVEGMDVVERLGKVPTNRKTIRDGYRSLGKAIGDARAKVDVCTTEPQISSMCSRSFFYDF